jgi:hypothetical protein
VFGTPSLSRFARSSSQELFEITNFGELPFHALR